MYLLLMEIRRERSKGFYKNNLKSPHTKYNQKIHSETVLYVLCINPPSAFQGKKGGTESFYLLNKTKYVLY